MFRVWVCRSRHWTIAVLVLTLTAVAFAKAWLADEGRAVPGAADEAGIPLSIVMYHGVTDDPSRVGPYVIPASLLASDLAYLHDHGYTTVTVADLLAYVEQGVPLPDRPVMLTFDDGYYNNFLYAHPLLERYGMCAVIAPIARWSVFYSDTPDQQDRPAYSHMTWRQIRQMVDAGTGEFQCHSYDLHDTDRRRGIRHLPSETREQYTAFLREDIDKAMALLTEATGVVPTTFVYPFGATDEWAEPVLREVGFRAVFTCAERLNTITRDPSCLMALGRYRRPHDTDSAAFFERILTYGTE